MRQPSRAGPVRIAAVLLAAALAACAAQPVEEGDEYAATLEGQQEVPPVATAARGDAQVHYDRRTGLLHWRVTHAGLSGPVTGAHIHGPAGPGQNAGVVIPFDKATANPITGQARVTAEQLGQLGSGQWYVNLHTARHPGGEIRGQLRPRR